MSYPNINDNNFNEKITNKFIDYKIPKRKKSFEQICFPKKFKLQPQQVLLSKFINPNTPYNGVLVYHKIGSGKTCTAISIAEQWIGIRKIIVVVPASLIGNFRGELRSKCAGNTYLTDMEREKLKELAPSNPEYKKIIKKSNDIIDEYYNIYSYHKFVQLLEDNKLSLRNSILIIDEIQNMVSEGGKFYNVLYNSINNAPLNLKLVLLSATPMFDKPVEIALTMNLLKIPFELPTGKEFERMFIKVRRNKKTNELVYSAKNLDIFKERIRGYVSYYAGASLEAFPRTIIKYVKCEMQEFQYKSYLTVLKNETSEFATNINNIIRAFQVGEIRDLPNNFFIGTRIISNIAFPNRSTGKTGLDSLKGKELKLDNLVNYSTKFYEIIKRINKSGGPVYVYSSFKEYGGLWSFVKVLESQGYKDFAVHGVGRKRFALLTGDEKKEYKNQVVNVYNNINNINGNKIKILLLSSSSKEGISLYNVRQAHILEPYWNWSRMSQVIGRSARHCSHKHLPEDKRIVRVYIYIATHPDMEISVDQYIAKMAIKKHKLISEFEQALKEIAFDCELNKNASIEAGDDINCDK